MKILVADALPESFADDVRSAGWMATMSPDLTAESLPQAIPGYDVLVVRSTRVTADTISAADDLSLIIRAGAGTNTIDVAAASNAAITVSNVPGKNAIAVAELTLALLLAIDRNIPDNVAALREGRWAKSRFSQAPGLHGRTFGIVGLGSIGIEVAHRVAALGMHLIAVGRPIRSPLVQDTIDRLRIRLVDTTLEMAPQADVVSFHVPLNDETRGMINGDFLGALRDGAVLLNTSRGELVDDERELLAAIESKRLRLGLDVFRDEPSSGSGRFSSAIARHPSVYGTHHIGASTEQAQQAVAAGVIEILEAHAAGVPCNAVNLLDASGTASLVVRHENRVGVLSAVLGELRRAGINVENMENRIFAGGIGAVASLALSAIPPDSAQTAIRAHEAVIGISVASSA